MKINEVIQRVQSLYSKGVQSDDTRLSSRHIYNKLLSGRARLFVQKINKRQSISRWNLQTLHCVELIKAMPYECPCLPPVGCVILRTKEKLPATLTGLNGHFITSVTSLEGSITYSETTWESKKYKAGSKYTANKPDYFIRDGYLYLTTKKGPKAITLSGLFNDPIEADTFPGICPDEECSGNVLAGPNDPATYGDCPGCVGYPEKEFVLDNDLIETLVEMASKELISIFAQMREDLTNDSKDSLKNNSK